MNNIRLGFIGFKHPHIFALYENAKRKSNVTVVAACEESEQYRAAAVEKGIVFTHNTYSDIINDNDINAVAIGEAYGERGALIIAALKAGKNVIADKPLCTSMDEFNEIERLSKENNLVVGLMLDLRDNGNVLAARKLISDGVIGTVNNISFMGQHPLMYGTRAGWYFEKGKHGGVINDIAIHGIDLARIFTGSDVAEIIGARCWNFYSKQVPEFLDSAQLMVRMGNGAGVLADLSYCAPDTQGYNMPNYWRFEITGDKGVIIFTYTSKGVELYRCGNNTVEFIEPLSCTEDYLDLFIQDVFDGKHNCEEYLKSTKQTLEIQLKS